MALFAFPCQPTPRFLDTGALSFYKGPLKHSAPCARGPPSLSTRFDTGVSFHGMITWLGVRKYIFGELGSARAPTGDVRTCAKHIYQLEDGQAYHVKVVALYALHYVGT